MTWPIRKLNDWMGAKYNLCMARYNALEWGGWNTLKKIGWATLATLVSPTFWTGFGVTLSWFWCVAIFGTLALAAFDVGYIGLGLYFTFVTLFATVIHVIAYDTMLELFIMSPYVEAMKWQMSLLLEKVELLEWLKAAVERDKERKDEKEAFTSRLKEGIILEQQIGGGWVVV